MFNSWRKENRGIPLLLAQKQQGLLFFLDTLIKNGLLYRGKEISNTLSEIVFKAVRWRVVLKNNGTCGIRSTTGAVAMYSIIDARSPCVEA